MNRTLLILACSLCAQVTHAEDLMFVNAKINDKRVRLSVDTGTSVGLILFRSTAERLNLGLHRTDSTILGDVQYWLTDECNVKLPWAFWSSVAPPKGSVIAIDFPSAENAKNIDGIVGWPAFSERIFELDATRMKFKFLPKVPSDVIGWTRLTLSTNWAMLALELPQLQGSAQIIIVDSGSALGVELPSRQWLEWKALHTNQPTTLSATYSPNYGSFVAHKVWAKEFVIGPLELTEVGVQDSGDKFPGFAATFGLAALKRLNLIVDGKQRIAYLRPKKAPGPRPSPEGGSHELIFMPRSAKNNELVAHVANPSSAFAAGIRDGDALLKIGERDVVTWRAAPGKEWHRDDPAGPLLTPVTTGRVGRKIELTLQKNEGTMRALIAPEEIAIFAMLTNWPSKK